MPQSWVDQLVLWFCCAVGPLLWIAVVFAGYRRERRDNCRRQGGRCMTCGYDTHGLPRHADRCPECGNDLRGDPAADA